MSADDFTRVAGQLRTLAKDNKRTAMSRVVLSGESLMKRETPVKTGTLRRSITSRVVAGGNRGVIGTNLQYARAVHEGTKPHIIRPKRAKALKTPYGYFKKVKHPGTKGNAFITRTRDRLRPIAERELSRVYGAALAKVH